MKKSTIFKEKKMFKSYLIFILLGGIYFSSAAQSSKKSALYAKSDLQLKNLHKGYLLFQLFDREVTKEAIRVNLGEKAVEDYQKELDTKHANIMAAFAKEYTFSKVLFFHSKDKEKLKAGKFNEVRFLTAQNKEISTDTINFSKFFIGEVSRIELDSAETVDGNGDPIKIAAYSFSALILRDRNFVQLERPFPFYVRTMQGMPLFQKKSNKLIESLNTKLTRRYSRLFGVKKSKAFDDYDDSYDDF